MGILASVLILVYILSRLVPGKVFRVLFGLHHYHHVHNCCCWCMYFNLCIVACGSYYMLRANMWLVLTALSLSLYPPLSSFTFPHPPSLPNSSIRFSPTEGRCVCLSCGGLEQLGMVWVCVLEHPSVPDAGELAVLTVILRCDRATEFCIFLLAGTYFKPSFP